MHINSHTVNSNLWHNSADINNEKQNASSINNVASNPDFQM